MNASSIDGAALKKMFLVASEALSRNRDKIDALNVFPVPDGDTGTNMSKTADSAAAEVNAVPNGEGVSEVAKAASFGALKGARGNSGVILSQLFRGFARGLDGLKEASTLNVAIALTKASETAYKSVMKPKEGTILTVARELGEKGMELAKTHKDFDSFGKELLAHGIEVLKSTKDMLPVLKQANVVDAGGQGIICMLSAIINGEIEIDLSETASTARPFANFITLDESIEFAYCTEFFINYENNGSSEKYDDEMKEFLDKIGDSIVVVADEEMMKVHVHSNTPGVILEYAMKYGYLSNIKIDNMRLQHNEKISFIEKFDQEEFVAEKNTGFIAVSSGNGFSDTFTNLGVDFIVEGGQTMNPSTDDFSKAIQAVKAEHVFILPNNKNIVLAAQQAANLSENRTVTIIPTESMPQGINALLSYVFDNSAESNKESMMADYASVLTGSITQAVRDTVLNGKTIIKDDYLCILDGEIEDISSDIVTAGKTLIKIMAEKTYIEFLSIYYSAENEKVIAEEFVGFLQDNFPDIESEIQFGGQAIYPFILAAN